MTDTTHRDHRTERQILLDLDRKLNLIMTAVEDLETAVTNLEADETAAATAFTALAAKIAELEANAPISEAQLEELATKAAAVGTALKAATPAA